ncbi:hypothetical protein [Ferrimonas futtsuensis]|uniref:hypothetical protein n=1 Tax=Ferrimonas futtsuensis TaxID=364764 RepID=UPI000410E083|nr:hypothetical protein [Ferrimonas futtsuensis]
MHRRKVALYRASHPWFNYLLLGLVNLVVPLMLLFAPLPGYLMFDTTKAMARPLGASLFLLIALLPSLFYWLWWNREELGYLSYVDGRARSLFNHLRAALPYQLPFVVVASAAFLKLPAEWITPWSLSLYGITLVLLAVLGFLLPLWSRIRFDRLALPRPGIYGRLLLAAMSSQVWFRLGSAIAFSLFALTWLNRVQFDALTLGLGAMFSLSALYFWITAYASHRKGLAPWIAYGNYVTGQFEGQLLGRLRLGYLLMGLCCALLALI